jgi:hypothetical protein
MDLPRAFLGLLEDLYPSQYLPSQINKWRISLSLISLY